MPEDVFVAFNIGISIKNKMKSRQLLFMFILRTQMLSDIFKRIEVMTLHKDDSRDFDVNTVENTIKMRETF